MLYVVYMLGCVGSVCLRCIYLSVLGLCTCFSLVCLWCTCRDFLSTLHVYEYVCVCGSGLVLVLRDQGSGFKV
jgi:hypothetical protein